MNRMLIFGMGVAIIGGAASGASAAATKAVSVAQEPAGTAATAPKPVIHRALHRHRVALRAKPPARDPRTAFAKGRTAEAADTRTVPSSPQEDSLRQESILRPRSVPTVSFSPPANLDEPVEPAIAPTAEVPVKLSDAIGTVAVASITSPEPAPSRGMEVMVMLGACAGAAMGVYGLLAFKTKRRRTSPAAAQTQSARAGLLSSAADRSARQKLFPHQLAMSFESRLSAGK
jgi:hypothetical protein